MDEPSSLGRLLLVRFRWVETSLLNSLREQGWPEMSRAQSMVMAQLRNDEVRISEIARQLEISRQAAQKTIASLQELGLVESVVDPNNSSALLVKLTRAGVQNTEAAAQIFTKIERTLAKRIGAEETQALRSALEADWGKVISRVNSTKEK